MRVLHVLQSNRFSGAENVVCQIITSMRADSDIDFVYCSRDGQIREALAERNITFAPLKEISRDEIKRVIDEVKPDVIHAHDRSASMVAALATKKIPIIAHMHVNNNRGISLMVKISCGHSFPNVLSIYFGFRTPRLTAFNFTAC